MKVIKITEAAYNTVAALAEEVEKPISEVASMLIVNKDKAIRMNERIKKELTVMSEEVTE